jgi:hypothetical protein
MYVEFDATRPEMRACEGSDTYVYPSRVEEIVPII